MIKVTLNECITLKPNDTLHSPACFVLNFNFGNKVNEFRIEKGIESVQHCFLDCIRKNVSPVTRTKYEYLDKAKLN